MSRRVTPPSQSPVEKFSDDENTILEPALRSIRYEGKNAIKQCMLCDAEGKYHELQSPNARQVVQHLLLHNIHREYMGVQIKEFFEAAKQQALIQKQIWLENFVKHLILKNQSFNQTDSPYFSKVTTYQVSNQKVKDKLDEMAQNALDNMLRWQFVFARLLQRLECLVLNLIYCSQTQCKSCNVCYKMDLMLKCSKKDQEVDSSWFMVIRDTLSIIRALTINSASLERLFSFFHRQTASFLRGSINKETLIKMGIIYTEIMQPEIQRWKQQQLINKLIDKRKGISISEQLMHWNEF
ncbi:Hypothetical_protein [Hexamita inflata]|uniref:Hypothetical_protein n=1 Tax=Hexamita inflata TaxID=28002 RepID=A0AA86UZ44_9EUKA|nr:Hypothetical protein HINF_LOCUS65550 [Hexamita inflata]